MTRINSSIDVKRLTDEHLLAEHREIKRLPSIYLIKKKSGQPFNIPKVFCLGLGHVSFFLDKFGFTLKRYISIRAECLIRGFQVSDYISNWTNIVGHNFWKGHEPTHAENRQLIVRISQRLLNSDKQYWHYYGKKITKQQAIKLLLNGKV